MFINFPRVESRNVEYTRRFGPLRGPTSSSCGGQVAYCHLGGPSQLDYLILGEFRFWVTFDVGSLDVGSILILGNFFFG